MLGLLQTIASSAEMVSAPEQARILGLLPIALIARILEALSLSSFLNNSQNSISFGLREIHVSIVMRDVNHNIERIGHVFPRLNLSLMELRSHLKLSSLIILT